MLLSTSWLKWGSLLIDTFRDMRIARDILSGRMLYTDTFYEYGFLPPYIMAFTCRIFGVHILTFAGMGIAATILASFLVYRISRIFMDWMISLLTVVIFLFVFAFGNYQYHAIFNFILPYSFATVFFILFALSALYGFLKHILEGSRGYLWLWIVSLTAAFLCRIDMTFPVWLTFVLVILLKILIQRRNQPATLTQYAGQAGMTLVPVAAAFAGYAIFLAVTGTFAAFKESNIDLVLLNRQNTVFASILMGTANLHQNLNIMGISCGVLLISTGITALGCIMVSDSLKAGYRQFDLRLYSGVLLLCCTFLLAAAAVKKVELQYRCMPVILLGQSLWMLFRVLKTGGSPKDLALLALSAASLSIVVRILFSVSPVSYGFALCVPGLIATHVFLFESVSSLFDRRKGGFPKVLYSTVLSVFLLLFASFYCSGSYRGYISKTMRIQFENKEIVCRNDSLTIHIAGAVQYLLDNAGPEDTVIAVPECEAVCFLSEKKNPLRYYSLPPFIIKLKGEDSFVSLFEKNRINYIVYLSRATYEQGAGRFGIDYATKLYAWIKENYDMVRQFGPYPFSTNEFGVAVFKIKQQR